MKPEVKTRKLQIELSEDTFAYLEMLAFGLAIERGEDPASKGNDWKGFDKQRDDFGPAVRELLQSVANSVSTGVARPGAWEREIVDSLTGWEGTFNRGMLAECIKDDVKGE